MAPPAARVLLISLMNAEEAAVLSQFETAAAEAVQAGAPVKHPSTRQLFAYWDAQRSSRRAP